MVKLISNVKYLVALCQQAWISLYLNFLREKLMATYMQPIFNKIVVNYGNFYYYYHTIHIYLILYQSVIFNIMDTIGYILAESWKEKHPMQLFVFFVYFHT